MVANGKMVEIQCDFTPEFEKATECVVRMHKAIDKFTANHSTTVGELVGHLAGAMGASELQAKTLNYAARLHDIGKVMIPLSTLNARRSLCSCERELMEKHVCVGADILRPLNAPFFDLAADIAEGHHEYADGSGYPRGLTSSSIPLSTSIVTLCDVYEALRATRSYKKGMSFEAAVKIITKGDCRGTAAMFNPRVFSIFMAIEPTFAILYKSVSQAN